MCKDDKSRPYVTQCVKLVRRSHSRRDAYIIRSSGVWSLGNDLVISFNRFPAAPLTSGVGSIAGVVGGEDAVVGIVDLERVWYLGGENLGRVGVREVKLALIERRRGRAGGGAQLEQRQDVGSKLSPEPHGEWRLLDEGR